MNKRYKVRIVSKRSSIDHDYYTGNKEVRPYVWDEPDKKKRGAVSIETQHFLRLYMREYYVR